MSSAAKNIIEKQVLELEYNGTADGIALQKKTEDLLRKQLLPGIESMLERYNDSDDTIIIDNLRIDISLDSNDMEGDLSGKILSEVQGILDKKMQDNRSNATLVRSVSERFFESLYFYLNEGFLPWWSTIKSRAEFNERLLAYLSAPLSDREVRRLSDIIFEEKIRIRVAVQFDDAGFWQLIKIVLNTPIGTINAWKEDIGVLAGYITDSAKKAVWITNYRTALLNSIKQQGSPGVSLFNRAEQVNMLFSRLVNDDILRQFAGTYRSADQARLTKINSELTNYILKALLFDSIKKIPKSVRKPLRDIITEQDQDSIDVKSIFTEPQEKKQVKPPVTELDAIFINNAGLVIIAPYLGTFFTRMELVTDNTVNNTDRALTLLHYIVTGDAELGEFESLLLKIICGMDIDEPISGIHIVSDEERQSVNELLSAVIDHWSILKSTSVDGLRESFLKRDGKLTFRNNSWQLQVQRSSFDMLLDHISWNFKMIKLPWMKYILNVEWN